MKRAGLWWLKIEYLLGAGLFALRLLENRAGFDPVTGLAVPSPARVALLALLAGTVAAELILHWKKPRGKASYADTFHLPTRELAILLSGCLLMIAGGGFWAFQSLTAAGGIAPMAAGVLAAAAGGGLFFMIWQLRKQGETSVAPTLPALFFGVFLVLSIYLPYATDPVLERYWLPVLAAAMVAYAFAHLSGFFKKESSHRGFLLVANLAVVLSLTVLADSIGLPLRLIFGGCALTLAGFTLLLQDPPASNK